MKVEIVIPHHLATLEFLNEWRAEFDRPGVHLIIVEDKLKHETTQPDWINADNTTLYTHEDIEKDLGKSSWIISRFTSAVRSYGLYKAWQRKPDLIITLDNDCFPDRQNNYFVDGHWRAMESPATLDWVDSTFNGFLGELYPRGFPYNIRNKSKTYVNHGLWSNIPDLDAASMLLHPSLRTQPVNESQVIPRYNFYPMCGMNLSFRPEVTPLMYFGLFGEKYGFDQFDDIWAGVFSKKVMDHLGWAVRSGYPSVEHRKQSNAFVNFKKQAGGMAYNEMLWEKVQNVQLTKETPLEAYQELMEKLEFEDAYFKKVKEATLVWLSLFK